MLSQSPEHALVVLLRQCFVTPICQLPTRYPRAALRSSRSHHTAPAHQRHLRSAAIEEQKRGLYARNGLSNDLRTRSSSADHHIREKRHKSTSTSKPNESGPRFAVLGGGITGLAAAHYLTREFPRAKITIYEGTSRLGGWLNSKKVDVEQGEVVFEQGPRNLRPNTPAALVTLDMVCLDIVFWSVMLSGCRSRILNSKTKSL
jgi:oxygen-dependent protoporphyrinogen oxidase